MKRALLMITAAILLGSVSAPADTAPFVEDLSQGRMTAQVVWRGASATDQYLGVNWLSSFCFGKSNCVVSNIPAHVRKVYLKYLLKVGDWGIYATCTIGGPELHSCGTINGDAVDVELRKNGQSLTAYDTSVVRPRNATRDSVLTIHSAYNVKDGAVWGHDSVDTWETLVWLTRVRAEIHKLDLDSQLAWVEKLERLRDAHLINGPNMQKLLDEIKASETAQADAAKPTN